MKKNIGLAILFIIIISSCHVFLGTDPDNDPKSIFDSIWNDFNEIYPFFEIKGIDWDEIYRIYSPQIHPGMNDLSLFHVCSQMLDELNDPHVILFSPFSIPQGRPSLDFWHVTSRLIDEGTFTDDNMFLYGTFKTRPDVGYIHIRRFSSGKISIASGMVQDWAKQIDTILRSLAHTNSIILDIRNNNGGFSSNAQYIASRFTSIQKDFMITRTKNGPGPDDFSDPVTWAISPATTRYTKLVVLLTNNDTISAAERFTLALRTQNHVIHVGESTSGAFSVRITRPLINGWIYTMSVQQVTDIHGNNLEGTGIIPDIELTGRIDQQLEFALDFIP